MISKWFNKTKSQRKLFIEAYFYIIYSRFLTLLFPFKKIINITKLKTDLENLSDNLTEINQLKDISWAVTTAAKYSPLKSMCLEQALAAQQMMKKRNISGLLRLGVGRDEKDKNKLIAHAWIEAGNKIVTGFADFTKYSVVSKYTW